MKTVQSHVLSSDPISLSDATAFLSAFNKSVCGGGGAASLAASHETCWFVRRALASFEELEQLHRKLKGPKSDRKTQNDDVETTVGYNPAQSFVSSRDVSSKPRSQRPDDVIDRKVEVEEESKGGSRTLKEDGGEIAEIDDKKKKKKKEKKVKGAIGNIVENGEVKKEKKKKKRDNVDENVGGIKEEEEGESKKGSEDAKKEEKKKKKRKSEVLENGEVDALENQQEKRKKRRKS